MSSIFVAVNMQKILIIILVILAQCRLVTAQVTHVSFDSVKICHDSNQALTQIKVKEFVVNVQNGQLLSFFSLDSIITYNGHDRKLTLLHKDEDKQASLSLQFTAKGEVVVDNKEKTITLYEMRHHLRDTAIFINLSDITLDAVFVTGGLRKIWTGAGGYYITIDMRTTNKGPEWDIIIAKHPRHKELLLSQSGDNDLFISLCDYLENVGIKLSSDKGYGIFNKLEGLKDMGNGTFIAEPGYRLLYSPQGILQKSEWKEPIRCE